ncbi:hypothetical protein [Chamaesiphon sp.]|uniref:hypothetical protein n=1 Tax=Chamaesiphon sp. TaxID=2814140 RepID=UPI003593C0B0
MQRQAKWVNRPSKFDEEQKLWLRGNPPQAGRLLLVVLKSLSQKLRCQMFKCSVSSIAKRLLKIASRFDLHSIRLAS